MIEKTITMAHGSGGEATSRLIGEIFGSAFSNPYLDRMEDASVLPGSERIAMTTDSFVVTPVKYSGGNIGRLAVCGTVNDLLVSGAEPRYLTAGFILQQGLSTDVLREIVNSMAETAREAGVLIVTGDTKVVEGGPEGGVMINTAGVGYVSREFSPESRKIEPGDRILLTGTLGDHHATILAERMHLENVSICSDNAPLVEIVRSLRSNHIEVHAMRDVTRGGLATVLNEYCRASGTIMEIEEENLPVRREVKDFCGILGLDPLYMGNEGKIAAVIPEKDAEAALELVRNSRYGEDACLIGTVRSVGEGEDPALLLNTEIGGQRVIGPLYGEGLPRIC